jgi:hypothetical protein
MNELAVQESLRRGNSLAAPIQSSCPDTLAWVGVYPLDLSRESTVRFLRNQGIAALPNAGQPYRIRTFEVSKALIEAEASIAEPEMTNKRSYIVFGIKELFDKLRSIGVPIETLELPFKSNYPI